MLENISKLDAVMSVFVFAFGACVGSFLNVVIWRMPRGLSVVYPPSHCPKCAKPIKWFDNIPIFSWLALGGKCRNCKTGISPRYIVFEAITGLLFVGLFLAYFVFRVRRCAVGPESFVDDFCLNFLNAGPMFIAHSLLLAALLAGSMIDAKFFMIPLSIMWTACVIGLGAAVISPHPMLAAAASPVTIAAALAGGVGLIISIIAQNAGLIEPSFIDAGGKMIESAAQGEKSKKNPSKSVGFTASDGINPRREILREVLFLLPAILLAAAAAWTLKTFPQLNSLWTGIFDVQAHPFFAPRAASVGAVIVGYMAGGIWIWATRIIATFIFGREAMGLGDVHILAAVGAVCGWAVAGIAFFLAPICGLAFAMYIMITKRGRELPYGPWLAAGSLAAMLLYDPVVKFIGPGLDAIFG